jgi:glycosyltransferase involved in cell wall biosynthesis
MAGPSAQVVVVTGGGRRGATRQARLLVRGLEREGIVVTVLAPPRISRGALGRLRARAVTRAFRSELLSTGAGLVIAFGLNPVGATANALSGTRVALVASYRGSEQRLSQNAATAHRVLSLACHVDAWVANSAESAEVLRDMLPVPKKVVDHIGNIVDIPESAVDSRGWTSRVLVLAQLEQRKRVVDAIRSFALAGPPSGWRLSIAGDGPLRDGIRAEVARLGIEEHVELLGWVDRPEALLREGGILIHPSAGEGTPNSVLEAMSFGLPVIAARWGPGADRLLGPEGEGGPGAPPAGVVAPVGDVDALASGIRWLSGAPDVAAAMGGEGRRRIAAWSWEHRWPQWAEVLARFGAVDGPANRG